MARAVKRILVTTKYRFIGDTVLSVPLVRAAARQWPDARITFLTGGLACELLRHCPYIDETVEFDPYRKADQGLRPYLRLVSELRLRRFDLALILNRSFHGAFTAMLSGVKRRASWSGFQGRDFLLQDLCPYDPNRPEIECYLDVLRAVSPDAAIDNSLELWVTDEERADVPPAIRDTEIVIGLQPGSRHAEKCWPPQRYAALAEDLIREDPARRIVLLGGPEERESAQRLMDACEPGVRGHIINLTGELSLRGTLATLTYLSLFVGNDTAIRHAAVALNIPSIALFGPTSAKKWGNAMPPSHQVIVSCSGHLADIALEDVLTPARTTLASTGALLCAR
jgi:heptosyltransferase-2